MQRLASYLVFSLFTAACGGHGVDPGSDGGQPPSHPTPNGAGGGAEPDEPQGREPMGGGIGLSTLVLEGAFRLPEGFESAGFGSVFNPANQSLILTAGGALTAEITIPMPSASTSLADLPTASFITTPRDAFEGKRLQVLASSAGDNNVQIGGYLIHDGQLYMDAYIYYDGSGSQSLSHFRRPLDLSITGQVSDAFGITVCNSWGCLPAAGVVSGPMTAIPAAYQEAFGAPAMTSQCCIPIISRTSFGPAFLAWDPAAFPTDAHHAMLLYYDANHQTIGAYDDPRGNDLFCGPTQVHGVVWPEGTPSILYFGRQGTGGFCYGEGVDQNPPPPPQGDYTYCYDPAIADKGNHTYPYFYQVWVYDAHDLLAVKNGEMQHWEPMPHAFWRLDLPFGIPNAEILGAAYDSATNRIFVTQANGDGAKPVIYVFRTE